eukprot:4932272-Prymnesium_polylepis.1
MRVSCGALARLDEDMDDGQIWTGWSGGRPGKRTGSPIAIPEGTELSVCGGAACEQGRGLRGGGRLTLLGCSVRKRLALWPCASPRAERTYFS